MRSHVASAKNAPEIDPRPSSAGTGWELDRMRWRTSERTHTVSANPVASTVAPTDTAKRGSLRRRGPWSSTLGRAAAGSTKGTRNQVPTSSHEQGCGRPPSQAHLCRRTPAPVSRLRAAPIRSCRCVQRRCPRSRWPAFLSTRHPPFRSNGSRPPWVVIEPSRSYPASGLVDVESHARTGRRETSPHLNGKACFATSWMTEPSPSLPIWHRFSTKSGCFRRSASRRLLISLATSPSETNVVP